MKITIHRGTNQIGGCVTELESHGYKVFIDYGEQLPGTPVNDLGLIDGLNTGDISKSALFISHYHGDHIGKIAETHPQLPVYIGKTSLLVFNCLERRLSFIKDLVESDKHKKIIVRTSTFMTFEALQKITIGSITITPLFVDHSAFDAYMFVVEADGKRILHTGDFRGHGFRSKGLIPTLRTYAKEIDYIISEGSNIARPNSAIKSEHELQKDFERNFRLYQYNFVFVSSTNIDRLFSLYHASKAANRCFICDVYQAEILKLVSSNHKHYTSFYDIDFDQKVNPAGRFFILNHQGNNPFTFQGKLKSYLDKYGFCMLIRSSDAFKPLVDEYHKSDVSKVYYSMWNGYLDNRKAAYNPTLYNFIMPYNPEYLHTSGHADIATLRAVFDTVNPKEGIIPIHTEAPEEFEKAFPNHKIIRLKDKEVYEIANQALIRSK